MRGGRGGSEKIVGFREVGKEGWSTGVVE